MLHYFLPLPSFSSFSVSSWNCFFFFGNKNANLNKITLKSKSKSHTIFVWLQKKNIHRKAMTKTRGVPSKLKAPRWTKLTVSRQRLIECKPLNLKLSLAYKKKYAIKKRVKHVKFSSEFKLEEIAEREAAPTSMMRGSSFFCISETKSLSISTISAPIGMSFSTPLLLLLLLFPFLLSSCISLLDLLLPRLLMSVQIRGPDALSTDALSISSH